MTRPVSIVVRGRSHNWDVAWSASRAQVEAMRRDGIEVFEDVNTIPAWAAALGLTRPWCFMQDAWNLRSPFCGRVSR